MAINFIRTNPLLGRVGTPTIQMIPTSPVTVITLNSGFSGMTIFNQGSGSLVWGGSGISVNSGNYLFVNARVEWTGLQEGWSTLVVADSVQTLISITEYRV